MAGKFKFANPEFLINPIPGEPSPKSYSTPLQKALLNVSPMQGMPPARTTDEAMSNLEQIKAFQRLTKAVPEEEYLYGRTPEDINKNLLTREDERGFFSKAFDTISKPFRYETSLFTAPVVAAIEAMQSGGLGNFLSRFADIYPELQKQAATGEREVSVYDALQRMGMSNWGAVPLGIGADILLSPSTYAGVGMPTKLGKLAKAATLATRAGETVDPASKVGAAIARLTETVGAEEAAKLLKFAPTASEQAGLGQRALLQLGGMPLIEGKPVFKAFEGVGDLIRNNPEAYKIASALRTGIRPPGVSPEDWQAFRNLERTRKAKIGIESKDFLEELRGVAKENDLTPEQLQDIFYALSKQGLENIGGEIAVSEVQHPTMLSALRAKYPGLFPNVKVHDDAAFKKLAADLGVTPKGPSFTTGKLGEETVVNVLRDPELTSKGMDTFASTIQGVEEGKNIFSVLPDKARARVKKAYGAVDSTPELAEQFGKDWEKFISGNDRFLSTQFKTFARDLTEKEGWHTKVGGVHEVTMPDGSVRRIVGDVRFVDEAQETVRQYAKTQFQKLIQEEQALGILNKAVDDYVPGIYRLKSTPFRGGKEFQMKPGFTKEKVFSSPAEAEAAGYEPVKDILELVGIRTHKSIQAQSTVEMMNDAAKLFGIPVDEPMKMANHDWAKLGKAGVDPENKKQLVNYLKKNGYGEVTIGDKSVFFQREIADSLNRTIKPFTNEETFNSFLQTYDKALNVWKGYVTSINPKFHIRNFVSNLYLLYLKDGMAGLNPFIHKQAKDILTGNSGQFITDTGKVFSYDDLRRLIEETGLKGSGFMSGEMGAAFRSELDEVLGKSSKLKPYSPISSKNKLIEFGRQFGTGVENEAKVVGFLNDLKKFGDPMEATNNTFKYLYDYMDLTSIEKNVAKRLIPFWTWMSKNIPNMLTNLFMQPGKFGAPLAKIPMVFEHKVNKELRDAGISFPEDIRPSFLREQGAFPINVTDEGRVEEYIPGMPYQDLAKLSLRELGSSVTPLAKLFTEHMSRGGYSMFMDRPFEQYKGQMTEAPLGTGLLPEFIKERLGARTERGGTYMPGETAALINTLLPMLRTPQKLLGAWKDPSTARQVFPSEFFGQKIIAIDPNIERKATLYDWLKNIDESRKVERGIERREGASSVLENKGQPLSLEELLRLRMLRYGPKGVGR